MYSLNKYKISKETKNSFELQYIVNGKETSINNINFKVWLGTGENKKWMQK